MQEYTKIPKIPKMNNKEEEEEERIKKEKYQKLLNECLNKKNDEIVYNNSLFENNFNKIKVSKLSEILKKNKTKDYYELINGDMKLNFFIDLEYETQEETRDTLDKVINILKKYFDESKIAILKGSRTDTKKKVYKNSYHIHVVDEVFSNIPNMRAFINSIPEFKGTKILDMSVYRTGLGKFRMYNSLKKGIENSELKLITNHDIEDTFITYIKTDKMSKYDVIEKESKKKKEVKKEDKKEIETTKEVKKCTLNYNEIKKILDNLPSSYFDDYKKWLNIGLALGSTKDEQYRELYHLFSSKSDKYNEKKCNQIFNSSEGKITIASIYQYAKDEKLFDDQLPEFDHYQDCFDFYFKKNIVDKEIITNEFVKLIKYAPLRKSYILKVDKQFEFMKVREFEDILRKYYFLSPEFIKGDKKIKKIKYLDVINENINLFTVNDIIFEPNRISEKKKIFNLFSGFYSNKVENIDIETITPLLNHFKEVWANNNEEIYNYIINWLASIVQTPQNKTNTALVFISKDGAGKNLISSFLINYVFGNYGINIPDINKITQTFNSILQNKIFSVLNEAQQTNDNYTQTWELMKNLITENRQIIEKKGIDPMESKDYNNYIFFSNNSYPIKITGNDRRYMVQECSNKYIGNSKYFDKLTNTLNQNTANHFYSYLLSLDLSNFNITKIPFTEQKEEQIKNCLPYVPKWIYHKYEDIINSCDDKGKITNTDLYNLYKEHCKDFGFKLLNQINFTKDFKKIFEQKNNKERFYIIKLDTIKSYFEKEHKIKLEL